jgi:general secretion pathway protein N
MLRWILMGLAGLVAALGTAVATAPARFVDLVLDRGTLGRVRLAESGGTVWNGSGRLVFADLGSGDAQRLSTAGVAVPGRIAWSVQPWPLLAGLVDAAIAVDGMPQPVRLQGSFAELRVGPGALSLPSVDLSRLGSPWNSIRPSGALAVRWDALTVRGGQLNGRATIELRDAASAMTPVRPLGSYRVDINGLGSRAELKLQTLTGPLRLSGAGTWEARAGLRFEAEATAEPSEAERLRSFLGLVGRREGTRTIIRIGA